MHDIDRTIQIATRRAQKFAVFAGAYGNVPATQACIEDAKSKGCDLLAFIGDAIGCCGHSNEILDLIKEHIPICVAGNHEQQAALNQTNCGCGYASKEDEILGCQAFELASKTLDHTHRLALATWPDEKMLDTALGGVLLCHGSPDQSNEFLYESRLDSVRMERWLQERDVVGFICTHTGLPWIRRVGDAGFAVNCGVVGKPDHDGEQCVHYAIVECSAADTVAITIESVAYDASGWARQLRQEGVPDIFITPLETGGWTAGLNSLPEFERSLRRIRQPPRMVMPIPARNHRGQDGYIKRIV
ncbi:MAG: metallophosphoesterase [Phycisphaerae bacterium]|nr:metallophosphoesterase [Phycisphaerae bacterium]